jgi:hypothetical protein
MGQPGVPTRRICRARLRALERDPGRCCRGRRARMLDEVVRSVARRKMKLSERSGTPADDAFSGRHPTSHERTTGLPWDASYLDGPAPWDIGRPQPAIVSLASEGGFTGR